MTKLEDRIRTSLHATATRLPEIRGSISSSPRSSNRHSSRGPVLATAAMAAVFVIVGGSWLLTRPTSDLAASQNMFPIPEYVPTDAVMVHGFYAVPNPDYHAVNTVVARETDGGFSDAVVVSVSDSPDEQLPEGDPIEVNGAPGILFRSDHGPVSAWWKHGPLMLSVRSGDGNASLALEVAQAISVNEAAPFDESSLKVGQLPQGLSIITELMAGSRDPYPVVQILLSDGADYIGVGFATIDVQIGTPEQAAGEFGSALSAHVRGRDAYLVEDDRGIGLVWSGRPGITVSVFGSFPEQEMWRIAESLDFISQSEWQQEYETSGPQLPSTTTTTALESSG
jgi:hypothetical protein